MLSQASGDVSVFPWWHPGSGGNVPYMGGCPGEPCQVFPIAQIAHKGANELADSALRAFGELVQMAGRENM